MLTISSVVQTAIGAMGVLAVMAVAVGGLLLFRRLVSLEVLLSQHDITGAKFQVMGTIYAVLLAFVVITVWQQYSDLSTTVETEAAKLLDLYRDADEYPDPTRSILRAQVRAYTETVINQEWDTMSRGHASKNAQAEFDKLWKVYRQLPVDDLRQMAAQTETLRRMNELSESRQLRLLGARSQIPPILWIALVLGGIGTVGFSYFFGARSIGLQAVMIAIFTGAISLFFYVITALDTPFSGTGYISPAPFQRVLHIISRHVDPA